MFRPMVVLWILRVMRLAPTPPRSVRLITSRFTCRFGEEWFDDLFQVGALAFRAMEFFWCRAP